MLEALIELIHNKKLFVILIVTTIFLATAYYVYRNYVYPRLNPTYVANKEFIAQEEGEGPLGVPGVSPEKSAQLYYFFTEWCPHCKKATPIWESIKKNNDGHNFNGYKVDFIAVDCDKQPEIANDPKFDVKGYPTIKLVKGSGKNAQVVEYDAKPDEKTLELFLNTVTAQ